MLGIVLGAGAKTVSGNQLLPLRSSYVGADDEGQLSVVLFPPYFLMMLFSGEVKQCYTFRRVHGQRQVLKKISKYSG